MRLSETQRRALAEAAARRQPGDKVVFDDLQEGLENAAFQQRDFEALLLQASLAERSGVASPHVASDQVKAYYEEHQSELGSLPSDPAKREAAWRQMEGEIRRTLAPIVRQEHQDQLARYVEGLKDSADIVSIRGGG